MFLRKTPRAQFEAFSRLRANGACLVHSQEKLLEIEQRKSPLLHYPQIEVQRLIELAFD